MWVLKTRISGTNKSYRKGTRGGYTQTNAEQQANIAGFREGKFKVRILKGKIIELASTVYKKYFFLIKILNLNISTLPEYSTPKPNF